MTLHGTNKDWSTCATSSATPRTMTLHLAGLKPNLMRSLDGELLSQAFKKLAVSTIRSDRAGNRMLLWKSPDIADRIHRARFI